MAGRNQRPDHPRTEKEFKLPRSRASVVPPSLRGRLALSNTDLWSDSVVKYS